MARLARVPAETYTALDEIRQALVSGNSLFRPASEKLWIRSTACGLRTFLNETDCAHDVLSRHFVQRAEGNVRQLGAELLYVQQFVTSGIPWLRKLRSVRQLLDSGAMPDWAVAGLRHTLTDDPAFAQHRADHVAWLVEFLIGWDSLDDKRRQTLLGDYRQFARHVRRVTLKQVGTEKYESMREACLYMIFPDKCENLTSLEHKRQVVWAFSKRRVLSRTDAALLAIRRSLEKQETSMPFGRPLQKGFDISRPPVAARWQRNEGLRGDWFVSEFFHDLRVLVGVRCARHRGNMSGSECTVRRPFGLLRPAAKLGLVMTWLVLLGVPLLVAAPVLGKDPPYEWLVWGGALLIVVWLASVLGSGLECRAGRLHRWNRHVHTYAALKAGRTSHTEDASDSDHAHAPGEPAADCIDFLHDHLKVLDTKFAAILQFHALLVAGAILFRQFVLPSEFRLSSEREALVPALAIGIFFGVAIMLSVRSLSRVQWGDLTLATDLSKAESQQVNRMIGSVVRRTARLRLATFMTFMTFMTLLVVLSGAVVAALDGMRSREQPAEPRVSVEMAGEDLIVRFESGASNCALDAGTRPSLDRFIDGVLERQSAGLLVVGAVDAQPIGPTLANVYGTNVGLALARARCVAGLLQRALAERETSLETFTRVRDAHDRSATARARGAADDRTVHVRSF